MTTTPPRSMGYAVTKRMGFNDDESANKTPNPEEAQASTILSTKTNLVASGASYEASSDCADATNERRN